MNEKIFEVGNIAGFDPRADQTVKAVLQGNEGFSVVQLSDFQHHTLGGVMDARLTGSLQRSVSLSIAQRGFHGSTETFLKYVPKEVPNSFTLSGVSSVSQIAIEHVGINLLLFGEERESRFYSDRPEAIENATPLAVVNTILERISGISVDPYQIKYGRLSDVEIVQLANRSNNTIKAFYFDITQDKIIRILGEEWVQKYGTKMIADILPLHATAEKARAEFKSKIWNHRYILADDLFRAVYAND